MHWILQENLFNETEWEQLVNTLTRLELPYSVHKVVPFVGELIPEPPISNKTIAFGSYSLRHAAVKHGWTPGVYDLIDQNFLVQKKNWGHLMLNADSLVVPFKDAVLDVHSFVRPIDDSKYFAGRVFEPEEFNTWRKGICELDYDWGNGLSPETLIQICSEKHIVAEYRFWVVNNKIVTGSLYKRGTRVIYSKDVDPRAEYLASRVTNPDCGGWSPHKAFVIDICETIDGLFKIVEINTINSSGFYAADVNLLVMALENMENK